MRIVAHMVTRNEAGRYLVPVLEQLALFDFDEVCVYDDWSTDGTLDIVEAMGAAVEPRLETAASFADNESQFRQDGWDWMTRWFKPDVVVAIDADELLLSSAADPAVGLRIAAGLARHQAYRVPITEVWGIDPDGVPLERVDGFWRGINGVRIVPGAASPFKAAKEGGGSVPAGHFADQCPRTTNSVSIAHLGYMRPDDRVVKHTRYTAGTGHNPRHVASILTTPTLDRRPDLHPWPLNLKEPT